MHGVMVEVAQTYLEGVVNPHLLDLELVMIETVMMELVMMENLLVLDHDLVIQQ